MSLRGRKLKGQWRSLLDSLEVSWLRHEPLCSSMVGRPNDRAYHAAMDASGWELGIALWMMMRSASLQLNDFHRTALATWFRVRGSAGR